MSRTYHVAFDDHPYGLLTTRVVIEEELVTDMDQPLAIAMVDDPLYEKLEQYVLANPSRERRSRMVAAVSRCGKVN